MDLTSMSSAGPVLGIRIDGVENAQGALKRLTPKILANIQKKAEARADQTVQRFNRELTSEYHSQWATHRIAKVKAIVKQVGGGVDIEFMIPNVRELQYITGIMEDSYFTDFPVEPFVITPVNGKWLRIPFPNSRARAFTRGEAGQFRGSKKADAIYRRAVVWGSKTGGFRRDVIADVAAEEGESFVADMEEAVRGAIVEVTT
jgi:hypothetical protein